MNKKFLYKVKFRKFLLDLYIPADNIDEALSKANKYVLERDGKVINGKTINGESVFGVILEMLDYLNEEVLQKTHKKRYNNEDIMEEINLTGIMPVLDFIEHMKGRGY